MRVWWRPASERQHSGPYLRDISQFQARLSELGLGDLELLAPVGVVDGSYLDWYIVAGPDEIALMELIYGVLFPGHPFESQDALAAARSGDDPVVIEQKWRTVSWMRRACGAISAMEAMS